MIQNFQQVPQEAHSDEIEKLRNGKFIPNNSKVVRHDPFLDDHDTLRIGGRLKHCHMSLGEKHQILLPDQHYIAKLNVLHFHENIRHQGRHLTDGAIRGAGYWITESKILVYNVIYKFVKCRRFCGNLASQKMVELPVERLSSCLPFTDKGVDCFGRWEVATRRTRGGCVYSKRWDVLFSFLSCRGVQ